MSVGQRLVQFLIIELMLTFPSHRHNILIIFFFKSEIKYSPNFCESEMIINNVLYIDLKMCHCNANKEIVTVGEASH